MTLQEQEIIRGSRYQRVFPESYFSPSCYGAEEEAQRAIKDAEDYCNSLYISEEKLKEKLRKYNNTRLQYLLKLYYFRDNEQYAFCIIHRSAFVINAYYKYTDSRSFLYKTFWTDIKDFFTAFHADFVKAYKNWYHFNRNPVNLEEASNFCDSYFKWLSQKLSEKGKVSLEEVKTELKRLLN